jgi:glycosyltransferase involved in cell wall biosynthesis
MNLLCVEQFSNMGGGQRSLLDLIPGFLECGWQVSLAAPGKGPLMEAARGLGCAVVSLRCGDYSQLHKPVIEMARYARETLHLALQLQKVIEDHQIDGLYVNGPRFLPSAAWVARRKKIPIVFHCHNRLFQKAAVIIAGQALSFSDAQIVACCEYAVKPLRHYVSPSRIQTVHNGVARPHGSRDSGPRPRRRIGVIGRIEKEKGQLAFLSAARVIANEVPGVTFVVVGAPMFGDTTYYDRVVSASAGLPVEFMGWQQDIGPALTSLDMLVVPSLALDALPRVIFEAFAAGVPVVAFPSGGISEIIKDGITGYLSVDHTPEALARRILSVLNEPYEAVHRVIDQAHEAWNRNHTLETYRRRMCHMIGKQFGRSEHAVAQSLLTARLSTQETRGGEQ